MEGGPSEPTSPCTPLQNMSSSSLRVRFIFLLQFPPPGPPPTSLQLKPDLIPLHMGNLLVYWAFLDGKLHCLSSWVEALEQFAAFLQLFSQG